MNPVQQFLEMVKERYEEIENLKAAMFERGEIIENILRAEMNGEITPEQARELIDGSEKE